MRRAWWAVAWLPAWLLAVTGHAAEPGLSLAPCRLVGVAQEARCGVLKRSLDPARPQGVQIDVHVAVLPALARNKRPDPVFFFAGGPGQSAIALAPGLNGLMARFLNRRDLVLIDQRGTGKSAPLVCDDDEAAALRPLREQLDTARESARLIACRAKLQALPYGDLRFFTTTLAVADAEAVRRALGLGPVNLVGGSYGSRAVLEYLRQFPGSVRRAVIDGVAPPDMVLMRAMSTDNQAAVDALLDDCERQPDCRRHYPDLRGRWQAMLARLPRQATLTHPLTGGSETLSLDREQVLGLVRMPLYVPAFAAALPYAISEAAEGRFTPLLGLGTGLGSGGGAATRMAAGMHFSVVCSEDMPRLDRAGDAPGRDIGGTSESLYRRVCADWPRGEVPEAFYRVPPAEAPVLVLSGAIDPVTPPRHGERVARALGPLALHLVVPNAGHGVMSLGCLPEVMFRFIDQAEPAQALANARQEAACAAALPRPPAYVPLGRARPEEGTR